MDDNSPANELVMTVDMPECIDPRHPVDTSKQGCGLEIPGSLIDQGKYCTQACSLYFDTSRFEHASYTYLSLQAPTPLQHANDMLLFSINTKGRTHLNQS
jgi:hypothetical protein